MVKQFLKGSQSSMTNGEQLGNNLPSLLGNVVGEIRHQLLDGSDIDQNLATEVVDHFGLGVFGTLIVIILTELEVFYRAIVPCVCFGRPQVYCT